ncbi:MAG: DUF4982 domain-containing protein, partial [Puniceicoccales bacterium]|nr:DUF4982 domain-containing protein [Puniceicoccales bacterium]
ARWRPNHPVAHILPHWNWPERTGQTTPVHLYTNADEAELFLNGTSQGRQKRHPNQYRFRWDEVKYTPGELKVTTWKNGKPWATATTRTTGPATHLDATADRLKIAADGTDLAFVTLRITDANGQTVPRSKNPIQLRLEGPGEIVATDNGDPTDPTPFKSPHRRAFNGLALAIIKARPNQKGTLTLHAHSEGLTPTKIDIRVE